MSKKIPRVSFRVERQKMSDLAAMDGHNRRTHKVEHADPDGYFERILGDPNRSIQELAQERLSALKIKPRKDAVVVMEFMVGASPEYFRDDPGAWGTYRKDALEKWRDANLKWLTEKYGDNLIAVDLHCDEATPHLHVSLMPIEKSLKKKRRTKEQIANNEPSETYESYSLNAKKLFGKSTMYELQDEAAAAVKHLGIERGLKGSKTTHKTLKQYYSEAELTKAVKPTVEPLEVPVPPFQVSAEKRQSWARQAAGEIFKKVYEQVEKLTQAVEKYQRIALNYKRRYDAEVQRSKGFWADFGSPEKLSEHLEENKKEKFKLKKEYEDKLKKVENNIENYKLENKSLKSENSELTEKLDQTAKSHEISLEKVKENYSGQVQELREQLVYVKNREQKLQEALQRR
jgi:hypothetical protein